VRVEEVEARAFTIPTDAPEADGTLAWEETTLVVAFARACGHTGLGYSYTAAAAAPFVAKKLAGVVIGGDALSPPAAWEAMRKAVRNVGHPGLVACAMSVDVALWDLKALLLDEPLARLLGRVREDVPIYGSGGFTSYSDERLGEQLAGWVSQGIPRVKMKVGSEPSRDPERVRAARAAIGPDVELFVDANGAYSRKQALALAETFAREGGVSWFEEPVSSDDLAGLRLLRDRAPAGMAIAAGEYGYDLFSFRRLLDGGAVDVLQADVTRCGGITALMRVAALCEAEPLPLSAHTAPSIHAHACAAIAGFAHLEYFHDHARIENMLFDGTPSPAGGALRPSEERPGLGLALREEAAGAHQVWPAQPTGQRRRAMG
jgi:L-alanine-DL-glutamate epimerase-like enolase superfamily enzyme